MAIKIFEKLSVMPIISTIAVAIEVIKAISYGIDVRGMIAKEAGAFLPALA
jgi:hypothetical protein